MSPPKKKGLTSASSKPKQEPKSSKGLGPSKPKQEAYTDDLRLVVKNTSSPLDMFADDSGLSKASKKPKSGLIPVSDEEISAVSGKFEPFRLVSQQDGGKLQVALEDRIEGW